MSRIRSQLHTVLVNWQQSLCHQQVVSLFGQKDFDKGSSGITVPLPWCGLRFHIQWVQNRFKVVTIISIKTDFPQKQNMITGLAALRCSQNDCSSSMVFTCWRLGVKRLEHRCLGLLVILIITWWSWTIQSNGDACGGSRVAGQIATDEIKMIEDVEIKCDE